MKSKKQITRFKNLKIKTIKAVKTLDLKSEDIQRLFYKELDKLLNL